jgi:murein DD-endopeptidase MepM/ murein hydrolase activator NlpD
VRSCPSVYWGYQLLSVLGVNFDKKDAFNADAPSWGASLTEQKDKLEKSRKQGEGQVAALTAKVAELQARLVRLDAVGERLTKVAKLDKGEFDFHQPPGVGGPLSLGNETSATTADFLLTMDQLSQRVQNREQQFKALDSILISRSFEVDSLFDLLPVENGYMSSTFGYRTDPFNGKQEFHSGIDFTAPAGTAITAVAPGVVTSSMLTSDYGNLLEINHGGSFETRYAHNKINLVKTGDVVKKGQIIALVGSTGRSTAPHVHFEVYKNGRVVDPATYLHTASR